MPHLSVPTISGYGRPERLIPSLTFSMFGIAAVIYER